MIMLNTLPGFNEEYEKRKCELNRLRDEYSLLIEQYTELTDVIRPQLESLYMLRIGRREHQLFSLQIQLRRLKREIALYQGARNRGEKITEQAVQAILERELAAWLLELEEQKKKIKAAEAHFIAPKLSKEESGKIKALYRNLVRKLHPDLNPSLPPLAAVLWNRIVEAHKNSAWTELCLLADMVDELLENKETVVEQTPSSMAELVAEIEKLNAKYMQLKSTIAGLWKKPPYSYQRELEDPERVLQRRRELARQILQTRRQLAELRKILGELKEGGRCHEG